MRAPYVPQIDGLRAIAVLAVLVFHLNDHWLPGGFAGVDVFFVVSGYVISRSMLELDSSRWWKFVGEFYSRRALRILPALFACLCISYLLTTAFVPAQWLSSTNYVTALYSFWGFGNYALLNAGDPYFVPRIEYNAFAHMWSLGVEEQFYFMFPMLFFTWLVITRKTGRRANFGSGVLIAVVIASLAFCAWITTREPARAYYGLPARFWELGIGGLLFQMHSSGRWLVRPGTEWRSAQLLASLVAIAVGVALSNRELFPFPWALPAVIGTAAAIDAVTAPNALESRVARWLGSSGMIWIGKRSYSLYLWHWPIYVLFRWTVGLQSPITMGIAIALTLIASMASFSWIETPFRRGPLMRHAQRGYLVFAGLACALVLSSGVRLAEAHRGRLSLSVTERRATSWASPWWRVKGAGGPHCEALHSRTPLGPDSQIEEFRRGACGDSSRARERPTHVFVSGNSHALAYEDMFDHLAATEPFVVEEHFKNECALFSLGATLDRSAPGCKAFFLATLDHVRTHARPGDILFLPSLRLPRLSDQWAVAADLGTELPAELTAPYAQQARDAAREEAAKLLQPIVAAGVKVIFEAPKPIFRAPSYRCSDWFNRNNPICAPGLEISRNYLQRLRQPMLANMVRLADQQPGIFIWDPFDVLCPGATCKAVVDGKPLFIDGDHVSDHANQVLYPSFLAFLRRVQDTPVRLAESNNRGAVGSR